MKNFNKRRFKYRANNAVLVAAAIVIFVLVNLLAEAVSEKFPQTRIDITDNGRYNIGETTKKVLADVEDSGDQVTIYYLKNESDENVYVKEAVLKYLAECKSLKYEVKNYIKDPAFLKKFGDIENVNEGSLIVEDADTGRHRIISVNEMFPQESYGQDGQTNVSMNVESVLTNTLAYCISDQETMVLFTNDHGEPSQDEINNVLSGENITAYNNFSLKSSDVPEDCDMLCIIAPIYDFSAEEIDRLDDYLDRGGSVQIAVEPYAELPRLENYLAEWGVSLGDGMVEELNQGYSTVDPGSGLNVTFPQLADMDMTDDVRSSGKPVYMTLNRSVSVEDDPTGEITATPVLYTTNNAVKYDFIYDENGNSQGLDDGERGVYDLCVYLEKTVGENYDRTARLLVSGSSSPWGITNYSDVVDMSGYLEEDAFANRLFFVGSAYDMMDLEGTKLTISSKSFSTPRLVMTKTQQTVYKVLFCWVLPLLILVGGIAVWLYRWHL